MIEEKTEVTPKQASWAMFVFVFMPGMGLGIILPLWLGPATGLAVLVGAILGLVLAGLLVALKLGLEVVMDIALTQKRMR